jgi:hypothetical protein
VTTVVLVGGVPQQLYGMAQGDHKWWGAWVVLLSTAQLGRQLGLQQ